MDLYDCTKTWRIGFILVGKSKHSMECLEREQNWRNMANGKQLILDEVAKRLENEVSHAGFYGYR